MTKDRTLVKTMIVVLAILEAMLISAVIFIKTREGQ